MLILQLFKQVCHKLLVGSGVPGNGCLLGDSIEFSLFDIRDMLYLLVFFDKYHEKTTVCLKDG